MHTIDILLAGTKTLGLMLCGGLAIALAVTLVTAPLTPRLAAAQGAVSAGDRPAPVTRNPAATRPTGEN